MLLLQNGSKEDMTITQNILWVYFIVLLCPLAKDNEKLQKPNTDKTADDRSFRRIWVIPLSKEPQPTESLIENKEAKESLVE